MMFIKFESVLKKILPQKRFVIHVSFAEERGAEERYKITWHL